MGAIQKGSGKEKWVLKVFQGAARRTFITGTHLFYESSDWREKFYIAAALDIQYTTAENAISILLIGLLLKSP